MGIISLLSVLEKLSNFEFDIIMVFKFELKVQFLYLLEYFLILYLFFAPDTLFHVQLC